MMSEKRFDFIDEDIFCDGNLMTSEEVSNLLNSLSWQVEALQEDNRELRQQTNDLKEAIDYLKTVIRYTIPNEMVADVFKKIGEEYD